MTPTPASFQLEAEVLDQREIARDHYVLSLDAPEIAAGARPGQFVMVRRGDDLAPLLPRAYSVFHADAEAGLIEVLYRVVGAGTARLAEIAAGASLSVWGPLGNWFQPPAEGWITLVGGGVGVPPLVFLAERLAAEGSAAQVVALIGAATAEYVIGVEQLRETGARVQTATVDGTLGQRGLVSALVERSLEARPGPVLACGPMPMLAAVSEIAARAGVGAQLCLEAPMACGVGACLGCTLPLAAGRYARVCREGPVFAGDAICWEAVQR